MNNRGVNQVHVTRSVPVGSVSDRVQRVRYKSQYPVRSQSNGYIKSRTFTAADRIEATKMNGFVSQGRVSGGKYLVTGTPQGVSNLGFSHSDNMTSKPPVLDDDLFEPLNKNQAPKQYRSQGHGHFTAKNGTLRVTSLALARRRIDSQSSFRRVPDTRNIHLSQFDIELSQSPRYQYRPGEEINGNVVMEVSKHLEIRYLELIVVGLGTTSINKNGKIRTQRENYINRQTFILGNNDSRWTSLLTPGKYVSSFRFRLAKDIPSTIEYTDASSGLQFDVVYYIKARLVDSSGGSVVSGYSTSSRHNSKNLVTRKVFFKVLRPFDINMLPDGNTPVNHTEEIALACGNNGSATVGVALDRSVFLAGDDVRIQVSITIPSSRKIKEIICSLQQHVSCKSIGQRVTYPLIQLDNKNPEETAVVTIEKNQRTSSYEVMIPTSNSLLTSFLYGCKMMSIAYSIKTVMKFSNGGGKLSIAVPIAIGPCAEPIYFEKKAFKKAVPVFNRPLRFPCFNTASRNSSFYSQDISSQNSRNINVVTKYKVSPIVKIFSCCCNGTDTI